MRMIRDRRTVVPSHRRTVGWDGMGRWGMAAPPDA
jgi:hypothetical protein